MKLDLTSVKKNPLLNRQEVEFKVEQAATPSRSNIRVGIAVALKTDLNQVYVREITTKTGSHTIEPKYIVERNQKAQPEPELEADAPAEEKEEEDA